MEKLQNHYTTPEQSKRLLELGVPVDSADCYYSYYIKTYAHSEYTEILWHRPRFITRDNNPDWNARLIDGTQTYLPCWSVGRLMEIYDICFPEDHKYASTQNPNVKTFGTYVDFLVSLYELAVRTKCLNFSKLEEE